MSNQSIPSAPPPWRLFGVLVCAAMLLGACRPVSTTPVRTPAVRTQNQAATPAASLHETPALETPSDSAQSQEESSQSASGQGEAVTSPTQSPTPEAIATTALNVDPNILRGQRVEFWHAWGGAGEAAVKALVDEFNASNEWGIVVVNHPHFGYDSLIEQVSAALEADSQVDLVVSYGYQALDPDLQVDLRAYLLDPLWGLSAEDREDFTLLDLEAEPDPDTGFGLPAPRSAQLLYYNLSWGEELGFQGPPQSVEEFQEQACTAAQANTFDDDPSNDGSGGWIISTHYSAVAGWLHAFGAEFSLPEEKGYRFNTPEVREALTFLRELYVSGCSWLSENEFPEEEFASRKGLFSTGTLSGLPFQADAMERLSSADRWTVIPFPAQDGDPALPLYGPSYRILVSTPEKELATWLFLRWLLSPENESRLAAGTGAFPSRQSSLSLLAEGDGPSPQYLAALELLPYAHLEPSSPSWGQVRWAVSDSATQLYRSYFELEQLPAMLKLLDQTANDLHRGD